MGHGQGSELSAHSLLGGRQQVCLWAGHSENEVMRHLSPQKHVSKAGVETQQADTVCWVVPALAILVGNKGMFAAGSPLLLSSTPGCPSKGRLHTTCDRLDLWSAEIRLFELMYKKM